MASRALTRKGGRRDDVFFFVLIDFLVQIIFFGLFIFVIYQAQIRNDEKKSKEAVDAAGVSDLTELTDELSRLAPVKLKELNDLIKQAGGAEKVETLLRRANEEGGAQASVARLDKLRRLEGADKPACLVDEKTRQPLPLLTVLARGRTLTVIDRAPQLAQVLPELSGAGPQTYSPEAFQQVFRPLLSRKPDCRYFIKFQERTELVAPRRAAGQIFYLMVR